MQITLPIRRPHSRRLRTQCRRWAIPSLMFLAALPVYAQSGSDPWENAVGVLKTAFTGTIAQGLSLVAIVVGGLMFAYGEGQSKKMLAGIVFGVGMAIGAVNFMAWLFPSLSPDGRLNKHNTNHLIGREEDAHGRGRFTKEQSL